MLCDLALIWWEKCACGGVKYCIIDGPARKLTFTRSDRLGSAVGSTGTIESLWSSCSLSMRG